MIYSMKTPEDDAPPVEEEPNGIPPPPLEDPDAEPETDAKELEHGS